MVSYPTCLVQKFSVSAFIQCADAKGPDAPQFAATQDGDAESLKALDVLTNAVSLLQCSACPLAANIQRAAREHGQTDFTTYLCDQIHPVDAGMCCLRQCLQGIPQEHSIEAFCNGQRGDLMQTQPLVPNNCVSNAEVDNGGSTSDDNNSGGDSNTDDDDESTTTAFSTTSSPVSTTRSPVSTTASSVNNPATTTATTTSSQVTPQESPSTGAGSRMGAISADHMKKFGFAVVAPLLAAF